MLFRFVLFFLIGVNSLYSLEMYSKLKTLQIVAKSDIFDSSTRYTHKPLLSCNPSLGEALYRYDSPRHITVFPEKSLSASTEYRCQFEQTLLKNSDENSSLSLTTKPLKLLDYHYIPQEKLLKIVFNDTIDIEQAKEHINLYKINNLAKTKLQYQLSTQNKKMLLLKITEDIGHKLELHIAPTLKTVADKSLGEEIVQEIYNAKEEREQDITLSSDYSKMVFQNTPTVIANDDGSFTIRLFFDNTFNTKPLREFITIEGIDSFKIQKDIYLDYHKRKNLAHNSYYAVDITSDKFEPNTNYKLTLKKGLTNYNRQLKEDTLFTLATGDRKSGVVFDSDKPYISSLGELGFSTINVPKATLIVEKITHDNYRYFINYHNGKLKDSSKFTQEILSKEITLDNPRNKMQKQKIILKELTAKSASGVYRITLHYTSRDSMGEEHSYHASKVMFVSDIGVSANLSQDQAFVSLLRLSDSSPIENALVELYSSNNRLIATTHSNKDGIATIEKKSLLDKNLKAIIASTSTDKSFLVLNTPLMSIPAKHPSRYRAFVYPQSKIIRPAGEIRAMITLKDREFISANAIPLKIQLSRLYEKALLDEVYTTDALGVIDFSYKMSHEDKTGLYELKVLLGDKVIGKEKISVEAFLPPKIENKITIDKPYYKTPELIHLSVVSSYLFGAPSATLKGKITYSAMAKEYSNAEFKGYSFSNHLLAKSNNKLYIDNSENIVLDKEGKAHLSLATKVDQQVPSILEVTLGATIMDDTQPVATYKSFLLYPYDSLVGIKTFKKSFQTGEEIRAKALLIEPLSAKVIDGTLSVIVKKRSWHYSYTQGHYNWESEIEVVDRFLVEANREFTYRVEENGEYIIEVHDRLGGHSATTSIDVSGWGYSNISPSTNLKKVHISFEDRLYNKGDILKVSLKSPIIKGHILVTLEGEKVYWYKSITLEKGSATVDIPLDVDLGRGLYIHATAIRNTDTPSTLIPFRATGYKFIKPDRREHFIKIGLEYNQTTPSKLTTPLYITTDRESALLVSVVDQGILNIKEQKPPKIFDYFNQKALQKILYYDIYDKVMQYLTTGTILSFGSDMNNNKRKKHLPPDNSDRVKPFMLWSNIIYTKDKKASFEMKIPEFNGKATIVVVALDNRSIGVQSDTIVVKDDIMIKPSYPRFILVGDRVEVPIRVFNSTKKPQTIELSKSIPSHLSLDFDAKSITIPAHSSVVIPAQLQATAIGKGRITLQTKLNNQTFSKSVTLLAMSPYALQTKTYQSATVEPLHIEIPSQFKGAKALVSLSDNLLGQLYGDLKYLVGYPYGCAEQTSSKISAMVYAKPFMREDRLLADSDHFINEGIKKLSNQQNGYGEFAYWEPDGYVSAYASLYASQTLLDLNASGYFLDKEVKERIFKALKNIVKKRANLTAKYSDHLRLYAGYILSSYNKLESSSANMLYDKGVYKNYYLSYYYMSVIFQNMGKTQLAKSLLDTADMLDYRSSTSFLSRGANTFLILYLKSHYFHQKSIDFDTLQQQIKRLYSTHSKALAFKALSSYFGGSTKKDMRVALELNGDREIYQKRVSFIKKITDNHILIEPLSGVVNYTVELFKHLPYPLKNSLNNSKKLTIQREFIDAKGNRVDLKNIEQGSRIYSKITVGNRDSLENIVLSQRVPACLDIVNSRIDTHKNEKFKDKNFDLDYKDIRDDRVLYFFGVKKADNQTTIYTPFIATTLGECHLPAVTIEAMYDSRINDYAKQRHTIVVKSKEKIVHTKELENKERVKALVREYYLLEESNADPKEFLKYFHFPLQRFFNKSDVIKSDILQNRERSNRDWIKKRYNISDIIVVSEDTEQQHYKVKIVFGYLLDNSKKVLEGVSQHLLSISYRDGKFAIDEVSLAR